MHDTRPTASPTTRRSRCTRAASCRWCRPGRSTRSPTSPSPTRPGSPGCPAPSPRSPSWPPVHLGAPRRRGRLRRLGRAGPGRHRPGRRPCPVMEGKACLFSEFGGLSACRSCCRPNDVDQIVETVAAIAPSFGGINLEDISAPRCFEIEARLRERLDIPVMHDDQHGTAIVVLAALRNAVEGGRPASSATCGWSSPGRRRGRRLHARSCWRRASATSPSPTRRASCTPAASDLTPIKQWLVEQHQPVRLRRDDGRRARGADVYLGLSGGTVPESAIASMAPDCIVFSLANPIPEVDPEMAAKYAAVVATGRSDLPNQINNVLAFPGIFRGAIDAGRPQHHRADEARRGGRDRRRRRRRGARGLRRAEPARPSRGRGRGHGGGRVRRREGVTR